MEEHKPISIATNKRPSQERGFKGRMAMKKPQVHLQNKFERVARATKLINQTINQWQKVIWTDESQFQKFG